MHHFLFLRLDGFYAQTLLSSDEGLRKKPLVIYRDKRVIDIDRLVRERQVYVGMALSEAKAILHEARFVVWEEEPYRQSQKAWLDICTEYSDVIEPCEQHSACIDLSLHPDPDMLAKKLVLSLSEARAQMRVITGMGCSKWIAKLASDLSRSELPNALPSLAALKTCFLTPVEPEHRERLEFLGYATIGEVAKIPLGVLRTQFGVASTHIKMCARGRYFEPVEAVYPPRSIAERIPFEGLVEDTQTLDAAIRELALAMSLRLSKEDKQGKDVVVTFEHETLNATVRRRVFSKPIQNFASALASLRLLIARPPDEPILAIRVRIENVSESKRIQQELTGRTTSADRERGAMAAFRHIRTTFGDRAIITGGEIVEPRRKQVLRAWKDATGWA